MSEKNQKQAATNNDYYHLTDSNHNEISLVDFIFTEWKTFDGKPCGQYVEVTEIENIQAK